MSRTHTGPVTREAATIAALAGLLLVGLFAPPIATAITYTVTNANTSGTGSLHWAIDSANGNATADLIAFNIPGTPPFTIAPTESLPPFTTPITIDATTQPGYTGTPIVVIDGIHAPSGDAFEIEGSTCVIRGLVIQRWPDYGIRIQGANGTMIEGNYIGLGADGLASRGNGGGIYVYGQNVTIGGTIAARRNIISANAGPGIIIEGSDSWGYANVVTGNYIGLNAAGTIDKGNAGSGIVIHGHVYGNMIGGEAPGGTNVIAGNGGSGIEVHGADANFIAGNYIGTLASGLVGAGNDGPGIQVTGQPSHPSEGNQIGLAGEAAYRNVISTNAGGQIVLDGNSVHSTVQCNYIGVDSDGERAIGNHLFGIWIGASESMIGGQSPGAGNLIAGNEDAGIRFSSTASSDSVMGNTIGLNAYGEVTPNHGYGIFVPAGAAGIVIGGTDPLERNIISGNGLSGIGLAGCGTIVRGNYVGTDPTGMLDRGNEQYGIRIQNSSDAIGNLIGGIEAGAGNVISGNNGDAGLFIEDSGTIVQRNWIGVTADGVSPLGNAGDGILLRTGASFNAIGDTLTTGMGNVIAFNALQGVSVKDSCVSNRIVGNSIYSNGDLGIKLGDGSMPNQNDPGDGDVGPNMVQNYPVITNASTQDIHITLSAAPHQAYRVEIFYSESCDPSGYGEGATHHSSNWWTTYPSGEVSFNPIFPIGHGFPPGSALTVTATDHDGNTSEFSPCYQLIDPASAGDPQVDEDGAPVDDASAGLALSVRTPSALGQPIDIAFHVPAEAGGGSTVLRIYDPAGRRVRTLVDAVRGPGVHRVAWDGADDAGSTVSSGVYLCRLAAGREVRTERLVLVR